MKRSIAAALASLSFLATACDKLDTGGGGEGDQVNFKSGYVFVRSRNCYVADSGDYGAARQLTTSSDCSWPTVSADGRVIVYVKGGTTLRKINPDGTSDGLLVADTGTKLAHPAIAADASRIAYVVVSGSGSSNQGTLHVVNVDGSGDTAVEQSAHDGSPSFYPDGNYLAVLSGADSLTATEVDKVEISSGTRTVRISQTGKTFSRAAVSPDGARVALEATSGASTHVYLADESGGDPALLAQTGGNERSPTWVSSGRVGFVSDAGGTPNVYEIDIGASTDAYSLKVADADQCVFGG